MWSNLLKRIPRFSGIGLAFIIPFGIYLWSLNTGLSTADNGEFQWVTTRLLVAHPPGFPLYTVIGYLFSKLPLPLSVLGRVSLFSAVTGATTLAIVYLIVQRLSKTEQPMIGWIAILLLGLSPTFWIQSTIPNIRALTGLFAALAFLTLVIYEEDPHTHRARNLFLFACAIGLGLSHHLSLAFMALIMGVFVFWVDWRWIKDGQIWLRICLAIGIALIPTIYLPLRDPTLRHPAEFVAYVLGLGFSGDFFYYRTLPDLWLRSGVMWNVLTFQFHPLVLLASGVGLGLLCWKKPKLGFLFGGSFLIHTLITASYRAPQTIEYMLPAYIPIVIAVGYGLISLTTFFPSVKSVLPIGLVLAAIPGFQTAPDIIALNRSADTATVTDRLLIDAPENGLILADWHWYTPLKVRQQVLGERTDVEIEFVFPRTSDYGADWANAIGEGLADHRPVIATHIEESAYTGLPPAYPQGIGQLFASQINRQMVPDNLSEQAAAISGIELFGYQIEQVGSVQDPIEVLLFWEPIDRFPAEVRLSLTLDHPQVTVGPLEGQDDRLALPHPSGVSVTRFVLTPFAGTPPGDAQLSIRGYDASGETLGSIDLNRIRLTGIDRPPVTQNRTHWLQNSVERTLIGYDWDRTFEASNRLYLHWQLHDTGQYWTEAVDLPPDTPFDLTNVKRQPWGAERTIQLEPESTHYVPFGQGIVWLGPSRSLPSEVQPGDIVQVSQRFETDRPLERDLGIAIRLIGLEDDRFTWAWLNPDEDNDIPALGAIPTLKWLSHRPVNHPRRLTISTSAEPGQPVEGFMRLYDVFSNEPLPILDSRIATSNRPWVTFDKAVVSSDN